MPHSNPHSLIYRANQLGVSSSRWLWLIILISLCTCLFINGLARLPITDRDEAHFAQTSRQILTSHNPWQLHFQDRARHLKPPGIYWLQAAAVHLFSSPTATATWPYRLPSFLGGLMAVLITFLVASRYTDTETAGWSAALLAASLLVTLESHLCVTDAALLGAMVLMQAALGVVYVSLRQEQPISIAWVGLFWGAMAIGVLLKGLTPLIALMTLFGLVLMDRSLALLRALRWPWGVLLLLCLTAIWLVPMSLAGHSNFLWDMVKQDALPKVMGGQQGHGMFPGFFLVLMPIMFWPGTLWVWDGLRLGWRLRQTPWVRFLMAWLVPNWFLFEIIPTKLPEYVMPMYPALAILAAMAVKVLRESANVVRPAIRPVEDEAKSVETVAPLALNAFLINDQRDMDTNAGGGGSAKRLQSVWSTGWRRFSLGLWQLVTLAVGACFAALPMVLNRHLSWISVTLAIVTLLIVVVVTMAVTRQRFRMAMGASILGAVLIYGIVFQMELPGLSSLWVSFQLKRQLQQSLGLPLSRTVSLASPILAIDYQEPSLVFLFGAKAIKFTTFSALVNANTFDNHTTGLIGKDSKQTLLCQSLSVSKVTVPSMPLCLTPGRLLLMKAAHLPQLQAWLGVHHPHWRTKTVAQVNGFNYAKGRFVQLLVVTAVGRSSNTM